LSSSVVDVVVAGVVVVVVVAVGVAVRVHRRRRCASYVVWPLGLPSSSPSSSSPSSSSVVGRPSPAPENGSLQGRVVANTRKKTVWTRPGVDGVGGGGGGVMAHAAEEHEQKTPQFIEPAAEEKNRGLNLYY